MVAMLSASGYGADTAKDAALHEVPLRDGGEYWLYTGCPDDDKAFKTFKMLIQGAELRDPLPGGAVDEKKRLDDADTLRLFILVPEVAAHDLLGGTLPQGLSAACGDEKIRCAAITPTIRPPVENEQPAPELPGIPNLPHFMVPAEMLQDATALVLRKEWPVRPGTDALGFVFDGRRSLRWVVHLPPNQLSTISLETLILIESRRRPFANDCKAPTQKRKRTKPSKPPAASDRKATPESAARPGGVLLSDLQGLAYSVATAKRTSLGAEWLQKLNSTRPILLYVWATWCEPCRADWPHLQRLHNEYRNRSHFLGVALDDSLEKVQSAIAREARPKAPFVRMQDTYMVPRPTDKNPQTVLDRMGRGPGTPPFFALFDRQGFMVFKMNGGVGNAVSRAALACGIDATLKNTPAQVATALCACKNKHTSPFFAFTTSCK